MTLLIMVLGAVDSTSVNLIENGIKQTWGKFISDNINIMYYYGNYDKNEIIKNEIFLKCDDSLSHVYQKTLDAFQIVYDNVDFDVILRTNISTYIRPEFLYKILTSYDLNDFFGSTFYHSLDSSCFAGCIILLSRDVIKKLLNNRNIENPNAVWDDTEIEYLLKHIYSTNYKNFKRLDIMENSLFRLQDPLFKIKYADIWAFRCKTSQNGIVNRDLDIKKMELLHKIFL